LVVTCRIEDGVTRTLRLRVEPIYEVGHEVYKAALSSGVKVFLTVDSFWAHDELVALLQQALTNEALETAGVVVDKFCRVLVVIGC